MVAKQAFPEIKSRRVNYNKANSECRKILAKTPDVFIIADLWVKDEDGLYEELAKFPGRLLVFDHHDSSRDEQIRLFDMRRANGKIVEQFNNLIPYDKLRTGTTQVPKAYCSTNVPPNADGHVYGNNNCSAYNARWFLNVNMPMIDQVNVFDMTGTTWGLPGALNYLYYSLPRSQMRKLLKRKRPRLNAKEQAVLDAELLKCANDFETFRPSLVEGWAKNYKIGYIEADKSKSYIFDTMLKAYDFIVLRDTKNNTFSFRGNHEGCDKVAERIGGGGHAKAAGAPSNGQTVQDIFNIFSEVL